MGMSWLGKKSNFLSNQKTAIYTPQKIYLLPELGFFGEQNMEPAPNLLAIGP